MDDKEETLRILRRSLFILQTVLNTADYKPGESFDSQFKEWVAIPTGRKVIPEDIALEIQGFLTGALLRYSGNLTMIRLQVIDGEFYFFCKDKISQQSAVLQGMTEQAEMDYLQGLAGNELDNPDLGDTKLIEVSGHRFRVAFRQTNAAVLREIMNLQGQSQG